MYPDPISPKSHPEVLGRADYDPFGLMPRALPARPRAFVTAAQVARARELAAAGGWPRAALDLLLANCRAGELPPALPVPADVALNRQVIGLAVRCALAHLLAGGEEFRTRGLAALRLVADACPRWTTAHGARAGAGSLEESRLALQLAHAVDLLAAAGLEERDERAFREMLGHARSALDACPHYTCGNHNTHCLKAMLAVGAAAGDVQAIHDALYGRQCGEQWRYGLIHQLRHDLLSDGLHWEGTPGYHFYTLMALTEAACILENLGVDLWHAQLPPLQQTDGRDLHRAYGPQRGAKCLKAAFDAPLHQAFPGGLMPLLHDSGLAHLRGIHVWGPIYEAAYEAYGEPAYAWLLNLMEREYPPSARRHPALPMPLNTGTGDLDFARMRRASYPQGAFSTAPDRAISLGGRHEGGCSLFPVHGSAMLRAGQAGAWLYWGPHAAGHMSPAALHLDLAADGRRLTDAPRSDGYDDPRHLTWVRTTIAHNTVTVDEASMFPYDFPTESIWEADSWRDRTSDGRLELFQPAERFKAVRASNESVYAGVRLDRTVVLTARWALDAYRVTSDAEHTLDWAMHCAGGIAPPDGASPVQLADRRGYCHLTDAVGVEAMGRPIRVGEAILAPPAGASLIVARDPGVGKPDLGELEPPGPRTCLIVRVRAARALFLSLWPFGPEEARLEPIAADAGGDIVVRVHATGAAALCRLPLDCGPIEVSQD